MTDIASRMSSRRLGVSPDGQEQSLSPLARLLATGYLRLLAQPVETQRPISAGREPLISVDSKGQQSVNWVDKDGERDA